MPVFWSASMLLALIYQLASPGWQVLNKVLVKVYRPLPCIWARSLTLWKRRPSCSASRRVSVLLPLPSVRLYSILLPLMVVPF